ncbi:MAG: GMP synthase subunit A [Halobacteria archaeon]|nr:GMP synthase subunit A [Halobacteria archaeon]
MTASDTEIIVVDNHGQFTHLEGRALRDLGVEHDIVDNEVPADDVLARDPDGVILSGGPSMERSGNSADYLTGDVPVLGICLGHQIIAREMGGAVSSGEYGGFADVEVDFLERDGLFEGLGSRVSTWASHGDEVVELPDGFVRTARSDVCEIEAMRHDDEPIYGVQWHPEVSHTEKGLELLGNFVSIAEKH